MAKFTLLLATFALFLLVANATIYRNTVVIDDTESRSGQQQRCQRQLQEQQELDQCKSFLSQRIQGYGPNPRQQQEIQQCCRQLEQLDTECRCPGLEQVTRSQVSQGQLGDQQKRQIIETAQRIPSMCGIRPTQCDFETLTMDNRPRNDQQRCQQQIQEQQQLRQCKSFLSQRIQEQQSHGSNPRQEQEIQQCCRQLEQLDTECRCPGLEQVTRSQVGQGQLGDQQKRQIIQTAQRIPSMCGIRPTQCDFETLTMDNRPRNDQQRCQQQIQEQQQLRQCKSFLSQRIQEQQSHGSNPRQEQEIQQCCRQLEQLDTECRCPGLEQVTRSQVSQGQLGDQQKRQIIQTAQRIPSMCGIRPTQCDFETLTMDNRPRNDQQRCQQQIQEQQQLRQCKSFLSQRIQEQQSHGSNPRQEQEIQQCCRQLEQLDTECRCPGLEQVTRSQVSQGQLGDQQKRQIIQTAQRIPSMCGIRPTQCDFETLTMDNRPRNDQQRCQQQIQEQQQLRQCKSFLSQRIQEQQPYGSNPRQEQEIQQCCSQLEQLDTECRCPGLKQVTRSQVSQSQLGDQQKRQIIQIAESIPSMCNMRPMECDFESSRSDM